jgi:RimJ/RimL family protein N-acetyltransferase
MKWVTTEHQEILGNWAMSRMKYVSTWGAFRAIGLIDESQILAVTVYNEFYEAGCAIHIAAVPGRSWATKAFVRAAFEYPFNQLGYRRLTGYVAAKNLEAQRLDEHLGFKREGYLREMLPDDDVIVYGMLKSECRFIGKENGRKKLDTIAA